MASASWIGGWGRPTLNFPTRHFPPGLEGGHHTSHIRGARHSAYPTVPEIRTQRGGAPGAHFSHPRPRFSFYCWRRGNVSTRGARARRHTMNPMIRQMPRQRQAARPTPNRGNARQQYVRYLARAHQAQLAGDAVEMENLHQHAEHYFRMMRSEDNGRRGHL